MNLVKLKKKLPTGWSDEADAMAEDELRGVIVESNNNIRVAKDEMEENEDFKAAKEAYKNARAPLTDAVKTQNAKIQYALHLLEQSGKL